MTHARLPRARAATLALALAACADRPTLPSAPGADAAPAPAASTSSSALASSNPDNATERLAALVAAEHQRAVTAVTPADQQHRDVAVRRAAARALARIGGDAARPGLFRALSDEDSEVIAWGAYGLGFWCKDHEVETVTALVARALSRETDPTGPPGAAAPQLNAESAIARAIGRCSAETSEPTLVAWLTGSRERSTLAALALGDLASQKSKLREETLVALLNLAAGSAAAPPVPEALYPIGRLEHVPTTVIERIRDVAAARLAEAGEARIFAVRALGRAGELAAPDLSRVLSTPDVFTPAERAEAARALKRLNQTGQRALTQALPTLAPGADAAALAGLVSDDFGVLLTVIGAMERPGTAHKELRGLAALPPPPSAPAAILRRIAWMRCAAAGLLAGADYRDPLLLACDVTEPPAPAATSGGRAAVELSRGPIGARAVVDALGRGKITGARLTAWRTIAESGERRARQAAIELIAEHEEIEGAPEVLAKALTSEEPGYISTAAEVIAKQPQRASEPERVRKRGRKARGEGAAAAAQKTSAPPGEPQAALAPAPAVVDALLAALGRTGAREDPETLDAVIEAVGALALKQAEGRVDELCRSSYPTTRARAEKALGLLRGQKTTCDAPPASDPPAELGALARAPVTLALDTDVGALTLTLDPSLAPVAVTRIVELARAGYYDGMVVHRVVPGFVTQFGAPHGDGFGGPPGKPALRCETSPLPFETLRVGVALAGRDTGSNQLFIMHARAPHLDGQYALIGTATGPWAAFVDGDLIRKVTLRE